MVKAFEKFKVLNERELHARYEINLETYNKTINIEGAADGADGQPLHPAGGARVPEAASGQSVAAAKAGGVPSKEGKKLLDERRQAGRSSSARRPTSSKRRSITAAASSEKHAKYMRDTVVPAMAALREVGDQLELVVPHEIWPLPTYREMLFVK